MNWFSRPWWVMGIVNITPDSFSDGGKSFHKQMAVRLVEKMIEDGVDVLDLGAESTRPGAQAISVEEELDRLLPVLEDVRSMTDLPISIDTYKPEVMQAALGLGANIINDVKALTTPQSIDVVRQFDCPVCLMHMQGESLTMQLSPDYKDVVQEVKQFLYDRSSECIASGISAENIVLDPGFGFGKRLPHNIALFQKLPELVAMGFPVLVGVSRKRMLGEITGKDNPSQRDAASVAAAVEAVRLGARIVRVHDVSSTVDALKVADALGAFVHHD